jgi:hypothetical protein
MIVTNGSLFAAGQWIQFINPAGSFRIIAITGNTLTIQNASADGTTPIAGNPVPPYQYPANSAFVTIGQPVQLTEQQFNNQIKDALSQIDAACFNNIPVKADNEQVFMLGYLKSNVGGPAAGACLRKMQDDAPYLDEAGNMVFQQPISAPAVNVPVPSGGITPNNSTPLNPNNGTGGGFLSTFVNPTTGETSYIDLFAGKSNNNQYMVSLSQTGQLSLVDNLGKNKSYWPDKIVHTHNASLGAYNGFVASDLTIATLIEESLPSWAKYVDVRFNCLFSESNSTNSIRIFVNNVECEACLIGTGSRISYVETLRLPITDGKFRLEIKTFSDAAGTTPGSITFSNTGLGAGNIRVSIVGISS